MNSASLLSETARLLGRNGRQVQETGVCCRHLAPGDRVQISHALVGSRQGEYGLVEQHYTTKVSLARNYSGIKRLILEDAHIEDARNQPCDVSLGYT